MNTDVQPICLPTITNHVFSDSMICDSLTIVGWGRDDRDVFGHELTSIDVTIRSNLECNYKYNGTGSRREKIRIQTQLPNLIMDSQFCADHNIKSDVGTCHEDSGGPAIIR